MTAFRSGFASVVGRPNVGKSTLVNAMVGEKVTIVSRRPNTTRATPRGVVDRPGAQLVLVDTPGLHKPRTALGNRLNRAAAASLEDVDGIVVVLDATEPVGRGDRMVLAQALAAGHGAQRGAGSGAPSEAPSRTEVAVAVNKVDRARREQVLDRLAEAAAAVDALERDTRRSARAPVEFFPVSALNGEGVEQLLAAVIEHLPEGPAYYPEGTVRDMPEASWVADLVREELLAHVEEELPHSIACRVTEWEWPYLRCEIVVERDSQKGIVIGRSGARLKEVGSAVRRQLPEGAYLELFVRVEPRWQQREEALDRLGL